MKDEDVALFRQAEQIANNGQEQAAYELFSALQKRYPEQIEVLFWIVTTTSNADEAEQCINTITHLQPSHPKLPALEAFHQRKLQAISTPVLLCPYCGTRAPAIIKNKTATTGWIIFGVLLILFFPLCWLGFFFYEQYYVCSYCGSQIATTR